MPDEMDRAQAINEQFQRAALTKARNPPQSPLSHRGEVSAAQQGGRSDCIDCKEPIPAARRDALPDCQRCIDCQQLHENWRPL